MLKKLHTLIDKTGVLFNINNNSMQWIYLILYKITFDLVYILVISQYFTYVNYYLIFNAPKMILSFIIFFLFSGHITSLLKVGNFYETTLLLLEVGYFIPTCTLYSFGGMQSNYFIYAVLYWLLLVIWYYILRKVKLSNIQKIKRNKIFFIMFSLSLVTCVIITTFYYNGINFTLSLSNVYKLRNIQKSLNMPLILAYILPNTATLIPIILIYCLNNRYKLAVAILSITQIAIFSLGGIKKYLFYLFLAYCIWFVMLNKERIKLMFPVLFTTNLLAVINFFCTDGMPQIANYIQRRTMILPITISTQYFDFFSKNNPDYLAQSVFRRLGLISEYNIPIQNMIGGLYNGTFENTASNGMCGDAFGNFGWLSLAIYPFLISFTIYILSKLLKKFEYNMIFLVSLIFFVLFTNGSYFSNMLSNGFILLILLLLIWPKSESVNNNVRRTFNCL